MIYLAPGNSSLYSIPSLVNKTDMTSIDISLQNDSLGGCSLLQVPASNAGHTDP
jgi:hypothetical protein